MLERPSFRVLLETILEGSTPGQNRCCIEGGSTVQTVLEAYQARHHNLEIAFSGA